MLVNVSGNSWSQLGPMVGASHFFQFITAYIQSGSINEVTVAPLASHYFW